MATHRFGKSAVSVALLSATLFLAACAGIDNGNVQRSASVRLTPNPAEIIVEPFNIDNASVLVNRSGFDLTAFKTELPTSFQDVVIERLQKIGPSRKSWTQDTLPDHGWLIRGEFIRIYAGSGILRNSIGFGAGQSVFTARVYVYDLSVSSTAYILSFDTGTTIDQRGSGSYMPGLMPAGGGVGAIARAIDGATDIALMAGGSAAGASVLYSEGSTRPFPNPTQAAEISPLSDNQFTNQYQDMARTARQIRDTLMYLSGTPMSSSDQVAIAKVSPSPEK